MELSPMTSRYSDVPHSDFAAIHGRRVRGHSDDDAASRSPVAATLPATSAKLHYNDAGPHREMAVDCPANFVGVKKEPPRLPRPLSNVIQTGSPSSLALEGSQTSLTSPGKSYAAAGSALSVHSQQAVAVEAVDAAGTGSKHQLNRDERDRSERLRRYQEELAKRREREDRINQEQEQLRASLRGSKKMQGLEEKRTRAHVQAEVGDGFDNPNYCTDSADDRVWQHKVSPVHSQSKSLQQNTRDDHIVEHMSKLLMDFCAVFYFCFFFFDGLVLS